MPRRKKHEVLPHLGAQRKLPNSMNGTKITREKAAELISNQKRQSTPPLLLYDSSYGDIKNWPHVVTQDDPPRRLILLPENATKDTIGSVVLTGRCDTVTDAGDLDLIRSTAILMVDHFTEARKGKIIGGMSSWSQNHSHGQPIKAAIHNAKESEKQSIKKNIYTQLSRCKGIFDKRFKNKSVGFEELLSDLGKVFSNSNNAPLCYIASKNLSNSEHVDANDCSRSFAFWVTEHDDYEGAYLLFPQWGLAIELCHGRYISWSGKECAHCSSVPKKSNDNNERNIYSLFTALPKNLYNEVMKKVRCDTKLRIRHNMSTHTEELLLCKGMEVQIRVIPPKIYERMRSGGLSVNQRKMLIKRYHYYQKNVIQNIRGNRITLKRSFKKTIWKMSKQVARFNLVIDK